MGINNFAAIGMGVSAAGAAGALDLVLHLGPVGPVAAVLASVGGYLLVRQPASKKSPQVAASSALLKQQKGSVGSLDTRISRCASLVETCTDQDVKASGAQLVDKLRRLSLEKERLQEFPEHYEMIGTIASDYLPTTLARFDAVHGGEEATSRAKEITLRALTTLHKEVDWVQKALEQDMLEDLQLHTDEVAILFNDLDPR